MQFNDFLSAALGIVSIATLAGLGFMRGTVTNLRELLADARNQIKDLKEARTEADTKASTFEADLAALGRVVTGEAHWTAVGDTLDEFGEKLEIHHEQAMRHWDRTSETLIEIRDELRRREGPL